MVMWPAWTVLFLCGLVQGATLKDKDRVESAVDSVGVQRRSVSTTYRPYFDWNKIADSIIQLARADIVQQGKTELSLPNVHVEDTVSLGWFKLPYELSVSQGGVGNLTYFMRSGDVLLRKDTKDTLEGALPVTFNRLLVRYGYYNVKVLGMSFVGGLEGKMDTISFLLTVYGKETDLGCTTSLKDVRVTNLGKISLNITGLGPLNGVASSILELFLQKRQLGIVSTIESVLLQELGVVLDSYNCDELHSLFLLGDV